MKILIVDDESVIADIIDFLVQEKFPPGVETVLANSGNNAIKILKEDNTIDLCISDHNMNDGMGLDLLRFIMETKSPVKFVLCSTVIPKDMPQAYPKEFVLFNIEKPEIAEGVEKLVKHLENFKKEVVAETSVQETLDFVPITVQVLSLIETLPADLYLKMSDNKYVKCLNKSDFFLSDDKAKYEQKLIHNLYFKKTDLTDSINNIILSSVEKIMDQRNIYFSDKLSMAHTQLVDLIKFTGITPELQAATQKNVKTSVNYLMKSALVSGFWKEMNLLGEYPSQLYTLHAMLASIIVKRLHWYSDSTMFKLTLACFLQDISLDSIPLMEIIDYRDFLEKEAQFTSQEVKRFKEHPQKSLEILKEFRDIPADIDRILIEQLEMPDGSGIPRQMHSKLLSPLTCVFIITGIFARFVLRDKAEFDVATFSSYLEKRGYSSGNFKESFYIIK